MKTRIVSSLVILFVLVMTIFANAETITITKDGNVRSGPATTESVIGKVKAGEKFDQINKSGEWCKVKLSDGKVGWVHQLLTGTPQSNSGPLPSRTDNLPPINIEFPDNALETQSRILVKKVKNKNNLLYFQFEDPVYRSEVVFSIGGPESLYWSSGSILVLSDEEFMATSTSTSTYSTQATVNRDGLILFIHGSGGTFDVNRIKDWNYSSDPNFPITLKVRKGIGVTYLCGKGTITTIDGTVYRLGGSITKKTVINDLKSKDVLKREAAAWSIGFLGDINDQPYLLELVKIEKEIMVIQSAIISLGKIGNSKAIATIERLIDNQNEWLAKSAKWAQEKIQERGK